MAGRGSLSKPGPSVAGLESAAAERFRDAEALLQVGRFAAAIAFGLYAVGIELKVVVCRRLDLFHLPTIFQTHDLTDLMVHSGRSSKIHRVKRPRNLGSHWNEILELPDTNTLRYGDDTRWDRAMAGRTLHVLNHPPGGVIPWLRRQRSTRVR